MRTTKQARKYNIKTEESVKEPEPSKTKETKKPNKGSFRVLIDGSNFLNKRHDTYADADAAGKAFVGRSNCSYMVVEGCD